MGIVGPHADIELDWKRRRGEPSPPVPFHLLKDVPELACGDAGSGNLIVQGDNLVALKALLPYYAGQVKCIYIAPPYNTGNEGWAYNDNVNSPLIRESVTAVPPDKPFSLLQAVTQSLQPGLHCAVSINIPQRIFASAPSDLP